jgi:drug/metabolite transporter (DMT)-like permease
VRPRDIAELVLLAALWGGSFLFMRYAAPAFGATMLIFLRVGIAAVCLLPLLAHRLGLGEARRQWRRIAIMGVFNSALPFVLIAWSTLSLTAGLASILNATTPIFAALVARAWLGERLGAWRSIGLAVGFLGVLVLAVDKADFKPGGSGWAILAMLAATASYGFAANYTRERLPGVPPLVNAAGSQLASALALVPFAVALRPATLPPPLAWAAVTALGVVCTAAAYILYFRLIAHVGAARAVTVTYLIPLFGMLWGALFLAEKVTATMLAGGSVILLGTALATGLIGRRVEVVQVVAPTVTSD